MRAQIINTKFSFSSHDAVVSKILNAQLMWMNRELNELSKKKNVSDILKDWYSYFYIIYQKKKKTEHYCLGLKEEKGGKVSSNNKES